MPSFKTLDGADVQGKRVLLRVDLNVPVRDGRISDLSRIERIAPTITELADKGARVIVVSHFDRPGGQRVEAMSLKPVAAAMRDVLKRDVFFADDCLGPVAEDAVGRLENGQILMLEKHALPCRRGRQRSRHGRTIGKPGRYLRQRRVLQRASRPCQHARRRPPFAEPCRPPDAARTRGADRSPRNAGAPGRCYRRRLESLHQARADRQHAGKGRCARHRRRHGQYLPRGSVHRHRQVPARARHA